MKLTIAVMAVLGLIAVSFWLLRSNDLLGTITAGGDQPFADGPIEAPFDTYNPVREGEETPDGFRQLLARDQIRPIYNPEFKSVAAIDWTDDTLVIGVALDGEAKAYPVSFLNAREMVLDWIGGTPILVSW